jgi:hypothetical protein
MDLKEDMKNNYNVFATIAIFVALIGVFGWYFPRGYNLLFISLTLAAFFTVLGLATHGLKRGIFINEVNRISLARFQIVVWTVVILSAFFAISIERVHAYWDICRYIPSIVTDANLILNVTYACDCTGIRPDMFVKNILNPLDVGIDWTLWALIGISTTSLVGSSLILGGKSRKTPDPGRVETTKDETGLSEEEIIKNSRGTRYGKGSPSDSNFMDIFEGDEIGNTAYIDFAKVQMFSFTVVVALAYYIMVLQLIMGKPPADIDMLPLIPQGLIGILGISHAGYLVSKGIDHTPQAGRVR